VAVKPTDTEVAILDVLWERGPSTVREVHEALDRTDLRYTTTLKQLQMMFEKGFVSRDDSNRTHVYAAKISRARMEEMLVESFMRGIFGGSAMRLVTRALSVTGASEQERRAVEELIAEIDEAKDAAD